MNEERLPQRKKNRLEDFDYSTPGAYFITICTENRRNLLGKIVGGGALDAPQTQLSEEGKLVEKYIRSGDRVANVTVDKFVIMPNHIHMILFVDGGPSKGSKGSAASGRGSDPSEWQRSASDEGTNRGDCRVPQQDIGPYNSNLQRRDKPGFVGLAEGLEVPLAKNRVLLYNRNIP